MNPYIDPNEQQVGSLQEESPTTLEQVKPLVNIIESGEIKVDELISCGGCILSNWNMLFACWRLM